LAEIKSFQQHQTDYDKSLATARAKLGAGWNFHVDYASFEEYTRGNQYRDNCGKYIYVDLVGGFVTNDIGDPKCDADVVEAINDKVGAGKTVTFKMGAKDNAYSINSRCNLTVDGQGITIEWNGDWYAYPYPEPYVCTWILANC